MQPIPLVVLAFAGYALFERMCDRAVSSSYPGGIDRTALCRIDHRAVYSAPSVINSKDASPISGMNLHHHEAAIGMAVLEDVVEHFVRSKFAWDLDLSVLTGWFELPGETGLLVPADRRGLLGNSFTKARAEIRPVFNGDVPANVWEWDERLSLMQKDLR